MSALDFVIEQMNENGLTGLAAVDLVADGKLHRFRPDWEPVKSKKRGWYVVFPFRADNGDELYSGAFGWFTGAESLGFNIAVNPGVTLSGTERARLMSEQAEKRRLADIERQIEAGRTRAKALKIWKGCSIDGHSQYAQRKRIACIGVRFSRDSLVLPVLDMAGELHGLQFIDPEGNKKFLTGTIKQGHFCPIASVNASYSIVGIAEGYATGVSCHMASKWPVFVAFDAGNLEPVAMAVRAKYQQTNIVIFGDDDFDNPQNPGRAKALTAARAVNGRAVFPPRKDAA